RDARRQAVYLNQQFREEDPVRRFDPALQSLRQRVALGLETSLGQIGQQDWVLLPQDNRVEHRASRHTQRVGGDTGELDVGALQALVDPIDQRSALLDKA